MKKFTKLLLLTFFWLIKIDANITVQTKEIEQNSYQINLKFNPEPNQTIYTNSINISSDNPNIELSNWQAENSLASTELSNAFDINVNIKKINPTDEANLFINYLLKNSSQPIEEKIVIKFNKSANTPNTLSNEQTSDEKLKAEYKLIEPTSKKESTSIWTYWSNFSKWIQGLLKAGTPIYIQILLVFLLGILMSLTPCIYPVIPITAGILQMQGSKSLLKNFLLSVAYAFGIATTFAVFGLTAAVSGNLFGQILSQPIFIIFVAGFLIYLALSMFGFYDMYVPKFLTNSNSVKHKGSFLSVFIFGAISGSLASPCLSPGLALLLSIVASLANKLLGFILLFCFGIGLSVPLIIVGTFSSSINLLPRAGMWMIEVKKIFGFLLLGMSFYYLNNIMPAYTILWVVAITCLIIGIYYIYSIEKYDSKALKTYKNLVGILLISSSIFVFAKAYQATFFKNVTTENDIWMNNYDFAILKAKEENKNLVIDIGASFCTLCKAIDKYVFTDKNVKESLQKFVLVKVDATDIKSYPYNILKDKYKVIGVPTILIINPTSFELIKRFEGEIYDMPKNEIVEILNKIS